VFPCLFTFAPPVATPANVIANATAWRGPRVLALYEGRTDTPTIGDTTPFAAIARALAQGRTPPNTRSSLDGGDIGHASPPGRGDPTNRRFSNGPGQNNDSVPKPRAARRRCSAAGIRIVRSGVCSLRQHPVPRQNAPPPPGPLRRRQLVPAVRCSVPEPTSSANALPIAMTPRCA